MSMADEGADREADIAEQPTRKPDETIAVLAVNFKKSRRVMFECAEVIVSLCRFASGCRLAKFLLILTNYSEPFRHAGENRHPEGVCHKPLRHSWIPGRATPE
jgi:hypothetical protein